MLAGAVELPGSAAVASEHAADLTFADPTFACDASALVLATAIDNTTTAAPVMGAILFRCMRVLLLYGCLGRGRKNHAGAGHNRTNRLGQFQRCAQDRTSFDAAEHRSPDRESQVTAHLDHCNWLEIAENVGELSSLPVLEYGGFQCALL